MLKVVGEIVQMVGKMRYSIDKMVNAPGSHQQGKLTPQNISKTQEKGMGFEVYEVGSQLNEFRMFLNFVFM